MLATIGCAGQRLEPTLEGDLSIESVTIVDAIGGTRAGQRVVTKGDRIIWIGDAAGKGKDEGPRARRVIDGRDRFLIPGLWDAHVHFFYDLELTEAMAPLFLAYGITSVRDTGGDLEKLAALREEWRASNALVPRLFFSGPLLDGRRVVYDGATSAQPPLGVSVPDPALARERVRTLRARGADFIKIYELVSPDVFDALVDEANRLELPIASHVPLALSADVAGPRVDSIEHLRNIELACAAGWKTLLAERLARMESFGNGRGYELRRELHASQRLRAIADYDATRCDAVLTSLRNTTQVPTLRLNMRNRSQPYRKAEWAAGFDRLPESVRHRWEAKAEELKALDETSDKQFADWSRFLVGELDSHGVPIAAGTDTPIGLAVPGESLHRELELLVDAGLSTREALHAATIEPARFFSLEAELGQVAVGMRADLVLLDGNPLDDIRNTRRIQGVVSRGQWLGTDRARP